MIFSQNFLYIEGRSLELKQKHLKCATCFNNARNISTRNARENGARRSQLHHLIKTEGFVEAFRPTTPGHSPGVGHSIKN
ncbi:hypothetical protein Tsubulata_044820 [Turnera subulata]|uniref:Uncharacterized protein n=1 Tax=Turnera subulata TaxID=218843 RepID=A0A9Q0JJQ5_9ROSI|nr:hypothetical protein Tsubulata_044820 [Turnera subulata]